MTKKVLIADDSKNIHKVIEIILEDRNCEFLICTDSKSLIEDLDQNQPDVVFLDFHFDDELNGYELARKLKTFSGSKVVLIFGTFDNVDDFEVEESHVDDFLFKPVDGDKLLKIFDKLDFTQGTLNDLGESVSINEDFALPPVIEEFSEVKADGIKDDLFDEVDLPGIIGNEEEPELSSINPLDSKDEMDIPDVIVGDVQASIKESFSNITLPSDDDLEYPSLLKDEPVESSLNLPQLLSSDILLDGEDEEIGLESLKLETSKEDEDKKLNDLKSEILKELDHDLWDGDNTNTHISTLELRESMELEQKKVDEIKNSLREELTQEMEAFKKEMRSEMLSKLESNSSVNQEKLQDDLIENTMKLKTDIRDEVLNIVTTKFNAETPSMESIKEEVSPEIFENLKLELKELVTSEISRIIDEKVWKEIPIIAEKVISQELMEIKNSIIG